jgi:hypothetical protein
VILLHQLFVVSSSVVMRLVLRRLFFLFFLTFHTMNTATAAQTTAPPADTPIMRVREVVYPASSGVLLGIHLNSSVFQVA